MSLRAPRVIASALLVIASDPPVIASVSSCHCRALHPVIASAAWQSRRQRQPTTPQRPRAPRAIQLSSRAQRGNPVAAAMAPRERSVNATPLTHPRFVSLASHPRCHRHQPNCHCERSSCHCERSSCHCERSVAIPSPAATNHAPTPTRSPSYPNAIAPRPIVIASAAWQSRRQQQPTTRQRHTPS